MTEYEVLEIETKGKNLENFWLNVIIQSFIDLMTKIETGACAINKKNAIEWMDLENKKFLFVCNLADINPKKVIKAKNRILKEKKKYRIYREKH